MDTSPCWYEFYIVHVLWIGVLGCLPSAWFANGGLHLFHDGCDVTGMSGMHGLCVHLPVPLCIDTVKHCVSTSLTCAEEPLDRGFHGSSV